MVSNFDQEGAASGLSAGPASVFLSLHAPVDAGPSVLRGVAAREVPLRIARALRFQKVCLGTFIGTAVQIPTIFA